MVDDRLVQVAIRIPPECIDEADALAAMATTKVVQCTRTEIFRAAIIRGMKELRRDFSK